MSEDTWAERWDEWVDGLLDQVALAPELRLSSAVAELRASELGRELEQFDDDGLAHMIDETVSDCEGFGVIGPRDEVYRLVDPSTATLATTVAIFRGRKLAHRITADDAASRRIPVDGPLFALAYDVARNDDLTNSQGSPVIDATGFIIPDWVDGYEPGRLVLAWREGYHVHFDVIDDTDLDTDGTAELQAIAAGLRSATAGGSGTELAVLVFDEICANPSSFMQTTPPIDELLSANGFEGRGDWWGPTDTDWDTPGAAIQAERIDLAADSYGLRADGRHALERLSEVWRRWSGFYVFGVDERPEIDGDEIADFMKVDLVPLAFFDMHSPEAVLKTRRDLGEQSVEPASPFDLFVDELAHAVPDSIAHRLCLARSLELNGLAHRAELAYRDVLRSHPTNTTALIKVMNAAIDASRFDEALNLHRRLFGPGSGNEDTLQQYAEQMITAGRNDHCPCGSGRKYKQCHSGIPLMPEPTATRALIFKLEMFAEQTVLADLFGYSSDRHFRAQLISRPEARDFLIHEGGLLDRFLEQRVDLLPPSELDRLRAWQQGRRDLYEIETVDPGVGMTLRNVRTGDRSEILEHKGSLDAQVGLYVLLRLETVDDLTTSYGAVLAVPPQDRDRVLAIMDDPEIEDLLDWLADSLNPPRLTTRDGEELMTGQAKIATSAPMQQVAELLDKKYGAASSPDAPLETRQWTDKATDVIDDETAWVRASMQIADGHVELSTMSAERHERYLAELVELLPDARIVEESLEPLDLDADHDDHDGEMFSFDDPDLPDDIREVLDRHIRKMEANWLHENIPALDGATPTEAANDPTRRPDLIRLLNTMSSGSGSFDADRLRTALGIANDE